MSDNFKKLVAILMAEDIQFTLHFSVGHTWFVRDSAVAYENHRWEVDDGINLVFWTKENDYSHGIIYNNLDKYVSAIQKTLEVN